VQNASSQLSSYSQSNLDTIAICLPNIRIENCTKNQESKDSALCRALNKTILNEINHILGDKYILVQLAHTNEVDVFKQEMDTSLHRKQSLGKKKKQQQGVYSYTNKLPVANRYILVTTFDGIYDSNTEYTAPLERSVRISQLTGNSMLAIPLNSSSGTRINLSIFLLDNETQHVLYTNEYQLNSDSRNLELIKGKLYKLLKPVYYYKKQ
jgi:hypothetical protein